jgi:hypothetical protein
LKILIKKVNENEIKLTVDKSEYCFSNKDIDQKFYQFLVENIESLNSETVIEIDNDDAFQEILKTIIENFITSKPSHD